MSDAEKLIKLAKEKFEDFGEADGILFAAVADGKLADYAEGGDKDKIENAGSWGERRIIKASRIEWLCRDKNAKELVTDKGTQVTGAKIEGTVDLSFAEISFPLVFRRCVFIEEINIQHSRIKFLNLGGSHTGTIWADGVKVEGSVFLRDGFKAKGEVRFCRSVIGGGFDCENGKFINKDGSAISADGMNVKSSVFLNNGFKAKGEVRFRGATIGGYFVCENGEFINEDGKAISADGMDIKGNVFLNKGFKAKGEVCFRGATIGGGFDCEKGEFINKEGDAISADGIKIKGHAYLRDRFKAEGIISFTNAKFGGGLVWTGVNLTEETILDLRNAKAGVLWDDEKSWPKKKGNLFLDGFVYEHIDDNAPKDARSRIEWLDRQGEEQFRPGPYEQLAKVLNKMGRSEDAKKILIEKEKKITRQSGFGWLRRFGRGILGVTIGYGYRPWRALWFIGAFILIGFIVFGSGYKAGVIVPAEREAYVFGQGGQLREGYPKFNTFVYSIEMFVPVVDLRMAKYWLPDANKSEMLSFRKCSFRIRGDFIRWYMWGHICTAGYLRRC